MNRKTSIAVGTTSKLKLSFLKEILDQIGINYEIVTWNSNSKVPSQPITKKDTLNGSINRAKEAILKNPHADLGLGIEVGYDKDKNGMYEMFCYASICEKDESTISCCSHKLLLPKFYQNILKENKEMHEHVKEYYKKDDHPATKYLAEIIDYRKPFIIEAVRQAILRYFNRKEFD